MAGHAPVHVCSLPHHLSARTSMSAGSASVEGVPWAEPPVGPAHGSYSRSVDSRREGSIRALPAGLGAVMFMLKASSTSSSSVPCKMGSLHSGQSPLVVLPDLVRVGVRVRVRVRV